MGSIKASYSAIEIFKSDLSTGYSSLVGTAEDIYGRDREILNEVHHDYEALGDQISRAEMLRAEAESKIRHFEQQASEAHSEAESADAEARYIESHPESETTTDSDGNSHTSYHVDTAAVRAAERRRDEALERERMYLEKKRRAEMILAEIQRTISHFSTVRTAVGKVGESIESDMYEIRKYINAMNDEAEYNATALEGVLRSLGEYLASKRMFVPEQSKYGSYAAHGGGASVSSGGGGGGSLSMGGAPEGSGSGSGDADRSGDDNGSGIEVLKSGVTLGTDLLSGTPTDPSTVPDKSELIEYGGVDAAKNFSEGKYKRLSKKAAKQLDHWQTTALTEYSAEGYKKINGYLRGTDTDLGTEANKALTLKSISTIASAIEGQKLPKDMNLFRGVYDPHFMIGKDWDTKSIDRLRTECIGTTFTDKGFCSTSIDRGVAVDFAMKNKGVVIEITAPKGADGIFMKDVSAYSKEQEVLLQKGSCFKITGIDYHPVTGYVIKTQLIGRTK